ncbi:hypothetical protein [Catenuloplanes atrovinosus]|uniref:Uncharacterized protein n=1 Tax=Catenuloplanes atrovinosus TaxID=137266 RepID=A0AAE3YTU3_9ACTN|nr:hypothetical protein [Catenuloplanes atrovinosus]MDR7279500.1 hypothetical protein [Catenuloplanes atrovinosus]
MSAVRRRLRSLALLELINIPLWGWAAFGALGLPATALDLAGFALFALLLAEGAGYWLAKLCQTGRTVPGLWFFRAARLINPVLLAAGLILTVTGRAWAGLFFTGFAVLEHVNYFHVQLMYDNRADLRRLARRGFRRSHLARDLAA